MDIIATARILLATILITIPSTLLAQTVYSWDDEEGGLTYGHTPPPGVNARIVSNASQSYRPEPGEVKSYPVAGNLTEKKTEAAAEPKQKVTTLNDQGLKTLCENARKNVATIMRSGIIRAKDNDGNITVLTDDEKQQRKTKNQNIIDENC